MQGFQILFVPANQTDQSLAMGCQTYLWRVGAGSDVRAAYFSLATMFYPERASLVTPSFDLLVKKKNLTMDLTTGVSKPEKIRHLHCEHNH